MLLSDTIRMLFFYSSCMDQKNTQSEPSVLEEWNIFDEFSHEHDVGGEIKKIQEEEERDVFFYIRRISTFLFLLNIFFFLIVTFSAVYLYIQGAQWKNEYSFLAPVCGIFLGKEEFANGTCYNITGVHQEYQNLYDAEKKQQAEKILPLLWEIYSFENFNASRKVEFLLESERKRLRPIDILNSFDKLKFQFSPDDKSDIVCSNIDINEEKVLSISCVIYSSDWDSKIVSLNEGNISFLKSGGTAISRASSFINFIANKPDSPFVILEKTKVFTIEDADLPPYTKKTTIQLKLEYRDIENLYF